GTVNQVHCATHTADHLAGNHPVGKVAILRDFHGTKDGNVNGAGTDHRKGSRRAEVARARRGSNSFLAGVDQLWVQLLFGRVCAHAENAVPGVPDNFLISRNESWHLGWDTNTKVDVLAVF